MKGDTMKRVIIIEDDQLLVMVEERLISKLGYNVIGKAASGKEGLRLINELKPDIVVTDHHLLDNMSGLELVGELRKNKNQVPVIFLSGETNGEIKQKASQFNCVDCLFKPVTMDTLRKPLNEAAALASELSIPAA